MPIGDRAAVDLAHHLRRALATAGTSRAEVHDEVTRFLVGARSSARRDPDQLQEDWIQTIPYQGRSPAEIYAQVLSAAQRAFHDTLPPADRHAFLHYNGANFMWDTVVLMSDCGPQDEFLWYDRWLPQELLSEVRAQLPALVAVLDALPFRSRGRVVLLGVAPFQPVYTHQDETEHLSEFMLLSFHPPGMTKRLKVHRPGGPETFAVPGLWFDENDPHEVEPAPWFSYTIRVDGEFDDEVIREAVPESEWGRLRRPVGAVERSAQEPAGHGAE